MPTGESVLDWQLNTFKSSKLLSKISIVAGYNKFLLRKHPNLNILINPNWEKTSPINILKTLPDLNEVLFTYGDTLFRESLLSQLLKKNLILLLFLIAFGKKVFKQN